MKTIIILAIVCFTSAGFAAPYLRSDAIDPATCGAVDQSPCPVSTTIEQQTAVSLRPLSWGPPVTIATEIPLEPDMSINYDLNGISPGVYRFRAIHHDAFGGVSVLSNPTTLGPAPPLNLNMVP